MENKSVQNLTKLFEILENTYKDFIKPKEVLIFSIEEDIMIFDRKFLDTCELKDAIPFGYSFYTGFNYSFSVPHIEPERVFSVVDMYVQNTVKSEPLNIYFHFKYNDKDYMFVSDSHDLSFLPCTNCNEIPIAFDTLNELCKALTYTILEHAKDKSSVSVQL